MKEKKKKKKQVGLLLDYDFYKQLKVEAVELDLNLASYVRTILKNRKNILHNISQKGDKNGD